jgi:hypothetical protein
VHPVAENLQVSPVGLGQPEKEAQQRRLPGPVRADQTMDLALRDAEIDAIKGDDLAKGLADPARANGAPDVRRAVALLSRCLESGQFVSGLGM